MQYTRRFIVYNFEHIQCLSSKKLKTRHNRTLMSYLKKIGIKLSHFET